MQEVRPPPLQSHVDPDLSPAVADNDAMEEACPPSEQSEEEFQSMTIPVEFTPGLSDSSPETEPSSSPCLRRRKRKHGGVLRCSNHFSVSPVHHVYVVCVQVSRSCMACWSAHCVFYLS